MNSLLPLNCQAVCLSSSIPMYILHHIFNDRAGRNFPTPVVTTISLSKLWIWNVLCFGSGWGTSAKWRFLVDWNRCNNPNTVGNWRVRNRRWRSFACLVIRVAVCTDRGRSRCWRVFGARSDHMQKSFFSCQQPRQKLTLEFFLSDRNNFCVVPEFITRRRGAAATSNI